MKTKTIKIPLKLVLESFYRSSFYRSRYRHGLTFCAREFDAVFRLDKLQKPPKHLTLIIKLTEKGDHRLVASCDDLGSHLDDHSGEFLPGATTRCLADMGLHIGKRFNAWVEGWVEEETR